MTSVRKALNLVGQSASIKQLAHQSNQSFPLSLRNFVGALPPGRIYRKVISLDFLQRKFDVFFNQRSQPLFKVKLHNIGSGDHRHSTVDLLFNDSVKGYVSQLKDDKPRDLGQLEIDLPLAPNPDFHFNDLNSGAFTANIIPGQPMGIEVVVHFETEGTEIIVNNFNDINLTTFRIKIRFDITYDKTTGLVDFKTDKQSIKTDASVNVDY